jgi:hypothetical protein
MASVLIHRVVVNQEAKKDTDIIFTFERVSYRNRQCISDHCKVEGEKPLDWVRTALVEEK